MSLMMPKPENLRGQYGSYVTSDVYHIAERLWELGQSVNVPLYVSTPERPIVKFGRTYNFVISEGTPVGERFVMYAEELDARIVERCERCLKIPFGQRFDAAEKECEQWEAEEKDRKLNEMYDRMGGDMRIQLERCNFTDPWGPKYARVNKTAQRHRRYKGVGAHA